MNDVNTKVRLYPFAINNVVSDEKAAKVVQGLHDLVDLGKRAASALRAIEKDGYHDAEVPYVDGGNLNQSDKYLRLAFARLPKILPHSRQDIPRLEDVELVLGDPREVAVKGWNYIQMRFSVKIHAIEQKDQIGGYQEVPHTQVLGEIRVNKRTLSYIDMNETTYRLYRAPHANPKGMEALARMASILAEAYVRIPQKQHSNRITQKTCDLRRSAEKWLLEEKIVHRICADVFDIQAVREVLES